MSVSSYKVNISLNNNTRFFLIIIIIIIIPDLILHYQSYKVFFISHETINVKSDISTSHVPHTPHGMEIITLKCYSRLSVPPSWPKSQVIHILLWLSFLFLLFHGHYNLKSKIIKKQRLLQEKTKNQNNWNPSKLKHHSTFLNCFFLHYKLTETKSISQFLLIIEKPNHNSLAS